MVSLADLMFAKVSAFSTRGFARALIDLLAIDQQRRIDWRELPVRRPPAPALLREFIERLMVANRAVAQATLKSKPAQR